MSLRKKYVYYFLFSFYFIFSSVAVANINSIKQFVVIFDKQGMPLFPIAVIESNQIIKIESHILTIENLDMDGYLPYFKKQLGNKVGSFLIFSEAQLAKFNIIGDVDSPGEYFQPKFSSVSLLNKFNKLYDSNIFDVSITLIKGNKRVSVDLENDQISGGVVYQLNLKKKKQLQPDAEKIKNKIINQLKIVENNSKNIISNSSDIEKKSNVMLKTTKGSFSSSSKKSTSIELKGYKLHVGDILKINFPEEEGFNKNFIINRYGEISLPEVGNFKLKGMTLYEAEVYIHGLLSEVFLGLDKLSVQLLERKLLITVLGYVKKPGEVELPNTGNIQMAINAAGGLLDGAQLNKFQLRRNDQVQEFNYKRYLDTGNVKEIPIIQSLDTIFVPSSPELGNVQGSFEAAGSSGMDPTEDRTSIKVFGEVLKPGSFAYIDDMTIIDALMKAGGVTRYASYEQIRVIADGEPVLFNLKNYLDGASKGNYKLKKGSTIFIPKQVEQIKAGNRVVYVMGQVQKPGAFETGDTVDFMSVLANAGGPNRYADTSMVRVIHSDGTVERFNLLSYVEGGSVKRPQLKGGDAIFVPHKSTLIDDSWLKLPTSNSIQLIGAVVKPGRYQWAEGINFMDVLSHAGGPNAKADIAHVKIVNTGPKGEAISRIFNLQRFLDRGGDWSDLPSLKGGVTVVFPELPQSPIDNKSQWVRLASEQAIYIMGAVVEPGRFAFSTDLNILDILSAAEGPKEDADLTNVRIIHRNGPAAKVSRLNLVDYFENGDESMLPDVAPGDSIFVPSRNRSWVQKAHDETIRVFGAVQKTGRYDFAPGMNLLDILAETGGPTETAYVEKITIINSSDYESKTHYFNLVQFMKNPKKIRLPVLRPGDTIFIPDVSDTKWSYIMELFKDAMSITSFLSLAKTLVSGG